jgi:hypothetical protein
MIQPGDARTLAGPATPANLRRCSRLIQFLAEESCDTGEEEGDEDPTGDLERQRVKGSRSSSLGRRSGSAALPGGWRVFLAGRCQRTTVRGGGRWMVL